MIEHFDNVDLILHQNEVSGQGYAAMAIMRMTASVCKAGRKPSSGCQRCVGLVIRSIGTGNTIVELRSLAMSNNVAR